MKTSWILAITGTLIGIVTAAFTLAGDDNHAGPTAAETLPATPFVQASEILAYGKPERLNLHSQVALILDEREGIMLVARQIDTPRPIASLTKLMTALVVLESGQALDEPITITAEDRDRLKGTRSRLRIGAILTRDDLLRAALAASDNRAAAALARNYPGGTEAVVAAMTWTRRRWRASCAT